MSGMFERLPASTETAQAGRHILLRHAIRCLAEIASTRCCPGRHSGFAGWYLGQYFDAVANCFCNISALQLGITSSMPGVSTRLTDGRKS